MPIRMKTSLAHLPKRKRDELAYAIRMISDEFEVEMIILFGSYARGDWQEELGPDGFYYTYQSDFDLLVVADKKYAGKHRKWAKLEDDIRRSSVVPTPVTLIHHSIGYLNDRLSRGHYFFLDIVREGILLYDAGRHELAEPRELTPEEYREKAECYFAHWFDSANEFFEFAQLAYKRTYFKKAAFELHQAVERYYSALLLVLTDYRPKTHDLERLGNLAAAQKPELLEIFPRGTESERQRFELLRRAYVDARYDASYSISRADLAWLAERVRLLQELTGRLCRDKIESF